MRPTYGAALLLVVTALIYAPTLRYGFVYEDLNDVPTLLDPLRSLSVNAFNPARALTQTSLVVGDWLSPREASGQHAVNVGLHLVNTALVVALAWLVLSPWSAVFAAAVFALHPMQVESVAYVSARADLLVGLGVLVALLATSLGSVTGALAGVFVACVSKESGVMAWALVPAWALVTGAVFPVRVFVSSGAALALIGALVFLGRVTHLPFGLDVAHVGVTSTAVLGLTALVGVPVGLTIDHGWHLVPLWLESLAVGALVTLTLGALWRLPRGRHWPSVAWLLTVLWCLPRFVMPNVEGLHEHHFVIPMIGWALCAGDWLSPKLIRAGV